MSTSITTDRRPRSTRLKKQGSLIPLPLMAFGAIVTAQALPAQVQYQYTGNPFTFVQPPITTSDRVTATLHLLHPLAPSTIYTDLTLLAGFRLVLKAGTFAQDSSNFTNSYTQTSRASATTDPLGRILSWDLVLGMNFHGFGTRLASFNPPSPHSSSSPFDMVSNFGFSFPPPSGSNTNSPGSWVLLDPAVLTANLIATVTAMRIQGLGSSLTDQLYQVLTGITNKNGRACLDLNAFANQVQAQTGTNITTHQSAIILAHVATISLVIPCP